MGRLSLRYLKEKFVVRDCRFGHDEVVIDKLWH